MPMSQPFKDRLYPILPAIADHFSTPFHIYDEAGIRETGRLLKSAFAEVNGFQEYFAVKALPNPHILSIIRDMGFGFDCSSVAELVLSRQVGATPDAIMFTSNNTSTAEFVMALANGGCILNLDDISLLDKLPQIPDRICFRYNPGEKRTGNAIIGNPVEAKYGISDSQFLSAFQRAKDIGVKRFGLHTMLVSNERNYGYMVETTKMLLDLIGVAKEQLGITFDFINIGGGLGIPYRPEDSRLDIVALGKAISIKLQEFGSKYGYVPHLHMESGRFLTGPHGVLVTKAINRKDTYRQYVGVDASMSALMRPGMYGAYHHIEVYGKNTANSQEVVDVVGALCENNDKFAIQRPLTSIEDGDLLVIQDTGAHGHSMGFNYNGRLRPQELLLRPNGEVDLIRRAETLDDYFATLQFQSQHFTPIQNQQTTVQ